MLNSVILNYRFWVTLLFSVLLGMFFVSFSPIFEVKPIMLLAIPMALIFGVILITKPKVILTGVILIRPLLDNLLNQTKVSVGGGNGGFGLGAVLNITIVILAIFLYFYQQTFPRKNAGVRVWLIFIFFMFLAIWQSPYLVGAVRLFFNFISYFCIFIIPFMVIKSREDLLYWLKVLCISFLLPIMVANVDMLRGGHNTLDAGKRISGSFSHPNILAYYLVLGIAVYFLALKSKLFKMPGWCALGIKALIINMLALLIATKSRNGWIAVLLMFLLYGAFKDRRLLVTILLVLPLSLLIPTVHERFVTIANNEEANDYRGMNSWDWRVNMWKSSFSLIAEKPLQGYGLATYMQLSKSFSTVGANGAHNAYLEVLFETGIFGALSYILVLAYPVFFAFRKIIKQPIGDRAPPWVLLMAFMFGYMVICFADNLTYYLVFNWYVWFFASIMLASQKFIDADKRGAPVKGQ